MRVLAIKCILGFGILVTGGLFFLVSDANWIGGFRIWTPIDIALNYSDEINLKEVHLDGIGLLNQQVLVSGKVGMVGGLGTYLIIQDATVRMLVNTSRIPGVWGSSKIAVGLPVTILGTVQSTDKGYLFLSANAIRPG